MSNSKIIPQEKIEEAIGLWEEHRDWGWKKLCEATGINDSTLRHIFYRGGLRVRLRLRRRLPTSDKEISQFYMNEGGRNKENTAKTFGIKKYELCKILIATGYPEEAWKSMTHNSKVEITPTEELDDTIVDKLILRLQKD